MHDADPQYTPCTMPVEKIIALLNTIDPLISKLKLLGDLSPLVDEASMEDKGRVAIGLLEIVADYVEHLEGALALFANRLPCYQRE
jgi:hypothetical protein